MASEWSGGVELPNFGPDNKAHLPYQFDFPKREFRKTKWSGGCFRLSHKDRTDSLEISSCLNDFIKGNEHRKTFLDLSNTHFHFLMFKYLLFICALMNIKLCEVNP